MTWIPLLLSDRSPCLRSLVLTELLGRSADDSEVIELNRIREEDPLVSTMLSLQTAKGSWKTLDHAGFTIGGSVRATSAALMRLAYLGFPKDYPAVKKGVEYLFSKQRKDGSWALPERVTDDFEGRGPYTMAPVQTSVPLLSVAMCGYGDDTRAEQGYDWLLDTRLQDGTWPAGKVDKVFVSIAGYRRLPYSKWGCRTSTTQSLMCFAYHPTRRRSEVAREALDHLLGRETRERYNLGFSVARFIGYEPHRGALTYHAKFDPGLILDMCARIGADRKDERVGSLVAWVAEQQGEYGLWQYLPSPAATRWISFDLLRALSQLDDPTDWISTKPRVKFQAYKRRAKRF
jgi:hypothetical protein